MRRSFTTFITGGQAEHPRQAGFEKPWQQGYRRGEPAQRNCSHMKKCTNALLLAALIQTAGRVPIKQFAQNGGAADGTEED